MNGCETLDGSVIKEWLNLLGQEDVVHLLKQPSQRVTPGAQNEVVMLDRFRLPGR